MKRAVSHCGAALLATALGAAAVARAAPVGVTAESGVGVYADGDATTVVSPHARAAYNDVRGMSLHAGWVADVISSASVDVVTAATGRFHDVRQEVSVGGGFERHHKGFDAGYAFSWENDTRAHTASLGGAMTWGDNLETRLHYNFNLTSLGRVLEPPSQWRDMMVHGFEAAALHPIGPRGTVELVLSGYYATGYQANPYRKVPVVSGAGTLAGALWFDEVVPDTRFRFAATVRARYALHTRVIGAAEYRFYRDTWGLQAHTGEVRLVVDAWAGLTLEARERFYAQGASDLYREVYTGPRVYMTRDRRQSAFVANTAGVAVGYTWKRKRVARLAVRVAADAMVADFEHYLRPSGKGDLVPYGWQTALLGNAALEGDF